MSVSVIFTVKEQYNGCQLKVFLRRECDVSASLLIQLKKTENGLFLNGVHARSIDIIHTGDIVTLTFPEDHSEIPPVDLPISVLYEDDHIIVYNKPPFMTTHPVHGHQGDTLANAAAFYALQKGEHYAFRSVNRLDRDTSGALLAAKNAFSAALLPKSAKKVYIGVCEGIITDSGTIDAPIRFKEGHTIQRETGEGGISAVTHYTPIKSGSGHTLLRFTLETGRTHQIRVHMSSIGHPLAGDDMYGGSRDFIGRQALHCGEISFIHPVTHEHITVNAGIPQEFLRLVR